MVVQDYRRAFFIGTMQDNTLAKEAALHIRKRELDSFTRNRELPADDRAASRTELRDVTEELKKTELSIRHRSVEETHEKVFSEEEIGRAKTLLGEDGSAAYALQSQANVTGPEVMALLMQ